MSSHAHIQAISITALKMNDSADKVSKSTLTHLNGDTVHIEPGQKVYIEMFYEGSPLRIGTLTSIKLNAHVYSDGKEVVKSALAFFVEIK